MTQKTKTEKHCWSEIGVGSNKAPTCPVLNEVIHCRNCPVYTNQGRNLLERPIPTGLLHEWTTNVAHTTPETGELSESQLIFRLGDEHFALSTRFFEEVISMRVVHSIPHRSGKVVRGLVAFRGRLELCVSMGNLLGVERIQETGAKEFGALAESGDSISDGSRILVISPGDETRYLFPVTAVLGTYRFPLNQLQDTLNQGIHHVFAYLKGIFPYQESTVGLMNPDLIFEALSRSLSAR